jgi:hypothetical protein
MVNASRVDFARNLTFLCLPVKFRNKSQKLGVAICCYINTFMTPYCEEKRDEERKKSGKKRARG